MNAGDCREDSMGGELTTAVLYNNRFCQYVKKHNRFFDVVFNDLIAQVRRAGSDENLLAEKCGDHIFYDNEPLYDYDLVTVCLYGIRYSEFIRYLSGCNEEDVKEYLKKLRKEALEAISVVELEYYTLHKVRYMQKVFCCLRPEQNEYSADDIKELEAYGIQATDRIREVV